MAATRYSGNAAPGKLKFNLVSLVACAGYRPPELPTVRREWEDSTWHNDICPSFSLAGPRITLNGQEEFRLWIEDERPEQREGGPDAPTYALIWYPQGSGYADSEVLLQTSDLERLNALLAALEL